jgi:hypothetical protein
MSDHKRNKAVKRLAKHLKVPMAQFFAGVAKDEI